mgnify:FL=1
MPNTSNKTMELPPRARRILNDVEQLIIDFGTTSACAENTLMVARLRRLHRNYLRVRGEYDSDFLDVLAPWELPPRARRIRSNTTQGLVEHGTTSACAENTHARPPR